VDYGLSLAPTFQPDLLRNEKVAWAGQPDRRFRLTGPDAFLVPFGIMATAFTVFWEAAVLGLFGGDRAPAFFVLWGIPFVAMGQYLLWGRFIYKAYRQRRTFYAVTNRRVLILSLTRTRQLQSLFLNQLPAITKTVRKDGTGTIAFGATSYWAGAYANSGMEFLAGRSGTIAPAFYDIPDVEGVYQLIMRNKGDLDQIA
jgi:hypothetical protein